jgi:hypothetical protein
LFLPKFSPQSKDKWHPKNTRQSRSAIGTVELMQGAKRVVANRTECTEVIICDYATGVGDLVSRTP